MLEEEKYDGAVPALEQPKPVMVMALPICPIWTVRRPFVLSTGF
jgi:hypothetical protein